MKNKLIAAVILLAMKSAIAQDTARVTLQEVLHASIRNNYEVLLAQLDQESAAAKFNQTNAVFLPQINLSYTALATNNPLNVFGFKLQRQSVSPSDFNPELLNNPSATQNYTTKLEWNQPILNLEMVYQRKAASQQIDIYHFKTERIKEFVALEAERAYALLQLSHQAVHVLEEALHTVYTISRNATNYFEKGYVQKSDLLLIQVQVASVESELAEARSNVRNASDYISLLMGIKSGPIYTVDPLEKNLPPDNLETQVPEGRADFRAMLSALRAQEIMIRSEAMSYLPRLNAFANYMLNDKRAFGFGSNSYLAGAQVSLNLFSGMTRFHKTTEQKIAHSRIEQQLNYQKEQSQLELNKTLRQLHDAQYSLTQHETSVSHASEVLRILQNRFDQGLVSTSDLLQAQSALSEQQLLLSETIFKHNTTLAHIHFLTSISEINNK